MTKADKRENIIMIASEPLTFERSDWMEVKSNTMIVVTPKVSLTIGRSRLEVEANAGQMNVLQIPIIDDFWVPPADPAAQNRSTDFAINMGFGELTVLLSDVNGEKA